MLALAISYLSNPLREKELERIYEQYKSLMFTVAHNILKNYADAEDAMQEALIAVAKNIDKVCAMEENGVKGYVFVVTKNAATSIWRKRNNYPELSLDDVGEQEDLQADVFEQVIKGLEKETILAALRQIRKEQAEALFLKYVCGYSYKEISELIEKKETTVVGLINRGKSSLISALKERE